MLRTQGLRHRLYLRLSRTNLKNCRSMDNSQLMAKSDAVAARKVPRYQAVPGPDKKYHCPFEREGCTHTPEKLKCQYE